MTISLLDERRCRGARWKAAATAAHERNGREASKGRGSRDTRGMKGWRPSAIPKGPKPVRAFCGRILCRTSDRSACLFPRGPGPRLTCGIRGRRGSLFALLQLAAARSLSEKSGIFLSGWRRIGFWLLMSKRYRPWKIDEPMLLPATVQEFVDKDHLARFVLNLVVEEIDLEEIERVYRVDRGQPPFDPAMMTALLLYGYCNGIYSSRRIAKACRERVDFMSIVGLDPPDFRTISEFRKRHLSALSALFGQVMLRQPRPRGLVQGPAPPSRQAS